MLPDGCRQPQERFSLPGAGHDAGYIPTVPLVPFSIQGPAREAIQEMQ